MQPTVSISSTIKRIARELGFDLVGVTDVRPSEHAAFFRAWLDAGRHGEMSYLAREDAVERRLAPERAWPALKSAVVVGVNYLGETGQGQGEGEGEGRGTGVIARYAYGRDYHKVLKKRLLALLARIEAEVGQELPLARAYVDTGPVLERELARRAGLGWFGRNAMIVNPKRGSYFFLATLLLELELEPDEPFEKDHCGTCSACVTACPTGALLGRDADGAPVVDATRCISYLTIEQRGAIPRELRPLIGNRIFGCDICQEVCPWNSAKFVGIEAKAKAKAKEGQRQRVGESNADANANWESKPNPEPNAHESHGLGLNLIQLMRMDEAAWDEFSRGSAVRRAKRSGFLRNVAVALGNWGSADAVPVLRAALSDPEPLIRGHAAWALGRVASPGAVAALQSAAEVEQDHFVRDELDHALAGTS